MHIKIREIIGKNAVSMKQGDILYSLLKPAFDGNINKDNYKIIIDFEDVSVISSPFFNASVCLMLKDYSIKDCQKVLVFENTKQDTKNILNIALQNAINFYK